MARSRASSAAAGAAPAAHKDDHKSGGSDPFTASDLLEAIVKRLRESGGATLLLGAIADGEFLKRSGTGIIGGVAAEVGKSFDSMTAAKDSVESSSATYILMGKPFIYEGTNDVNAITVVKAITRVTAGDYDFRLQDVTNSLTICEITGLSNTTNAIIDFGAISNLPTDDAMFEIQSLSQGGAGTATLESTYILF